MAVISGDGIFTRAMLRANDLDASARFYDAALSPLGWKNLGPFDDERMPWGRNKPAFPVVRPGTGEASSSGVTIGFAAEATRGVDAFHAAAPTRVRQHHEGICPGAMRPIFAIQAATKCAPMPWATATDRWRRSAPTWPLAASRAFIDTLPRRPVPR